MADRDTGSAKLLKALKAERNKARDATRALHRERDARQAVSQAVKREKEAAKDADRRAHEAELRLIRLEVCLDAGLPREAADRLRGTNREELAADADDLVSLRASAR